MGLTPTITNTFAPNTKAKSLQVNANFTDTVEFLTLGTYDAYVNGISVRRTSNGDVTFADNQVYMTAYHQIGGNGTATTYNLATSTTRMVCFTELVVLSGSSLIVASGAEVRVI